MERWERVIHEHGYDFEVDTTTQTSAERADAIVKHLARD